MHGSEVNVSVYCYLRSEGPPYNNRKGNIELMLKPYRLDKYGHTLAIFGNSFLVIR